MLAPVWVFDFDTIAGVIAISENQCPALGFT